MRLIFRLLLVGLSALSVQASVLADAYDLQRREAGHPTTTVERLWQLRESPDWRVRQVIARNRRAPVDLLHQLAMDIHPQVRIGVATNLKTAEKTFILLAKDKDIAVRSVVSRFEYVPLTALQILARDSRAEIRLEVARNLNSDARVLEFLSKDGDPDVSATAQQGLQRLSEPAD